MTRFSAAARSERVSLFADAVAAHRERGSPFLTVEADPSGAAGPGASSSDPEAEEAAGPAPWVQYAADRGRLNLDCTDAELGAIESAIRAFGGARIVERVSPEDADGTNLQVAVEGDDDRIASLIETLFRDGFGLGDGYRAWVTRI